MSDSRNSDSGSDSAIKQIHQDLFYKLACEAGQIGLLF